VIDGRAARGGRSGSSRSYDRVAYLPYLIPGLLLFIGVIAIPFAMNIGISFTRWPGVGTPEWIGLGNYRELAGDGEFWASFRHNAALVVGMAIVPAAIGLVLAAALTDVIDRRFGPRAASVLRACIYLPQLLPVVVAGIVWSWILAPEDGAANAFLELIGLDSLAHDWLGDPATAMWSVVVVMIWFQIGFPLVIFMSGMQRLDPSLYEAAEIDGASWWRRFWHITLTQIRPEIFVVLLITTIYSLKSFPQIYVLTKGGPGGATNVPSYYSYQNFFERTEVGYGASIATTLTLITVVLAIGFIRVQRRSEEGSPQ
jgi:raffinose/stachyose/melibiose transport system permease protein